MVNVNERKLYKVLRNVGVKPSFIKKADKIDDLYLDDFDYQLLVFYFEKEFDVQLCSEEIEMLSTLPDFYKYVNNHCLN